MSVCEDCGCESHIKWGSLGDARLCFPCAEKRKQAKVIERSAEIKHPSDFETWDHGDMSELFWVHLGKYVKNPNPESINYMNMAFLWACHDSHGLSNSFDHAMKWAGIDLHKELSRWRATG